MTISTQSMLEWVFMQQCLGLECISNPFLKESQNRSNDSQDLSYFIQFSSQE